MTAYRVIDDHKELENIGVHTHVELDSHIDNTHFLVLSASGDLPPSSRYITAGPNITIADGGPGSALTISSPSFVFSNDLTVNLTSGKTFGRFDSGQSIPATGKTPAEVILMALTEPIPPDVSLTATSPLTSEFNVTGVVTNSLTGSYTLKSSGAAVSSASLYYRLNGSGSWYVLTSSFSDLLKYDHVFVSPSFFTSTINYQYVVVDTMGATATSTFDVTPASYVSPSVSLGVDSVNRSFSIETSTKRELGNTSSRITGTIVKRSARVPLASYSVQFSSDGGTWSDVPGLSAVPVVGDPSSVTIPTTTHHDSSLLNSSTLSYRIAAVDEYQAVYSTTVTVSLLPVIFYGPSQTLPTTSEGVRALPVESFIDSSSSLTLNTGTTYRNFAISLPSPSILSTVVDIDALQADITSVYTPATVSVSDSGGTHRTYNVYVMTAAIPYATSHRHVFTRV